MRQFTKILLLGAAPLAFAACDNNDIDLEPEPTPTPTPTGQFEDNFGDSFGAAFRIDANGDPIDPMEGDIIDVSLTDDPVDVENQGEGN